MVQYGRAFVLPEHFIFVTPTTVVECTAKVEILINCKIEIHKAETERIK